MGIRPRPEIVTLLRFKTGMRSSMRLRGDAHLHLMRHMRLSTLCPLTLCAWYYTATPIVVILSEPERLGVQRSGGGVPVGKRGATDAVS